MTAHDYTTFAEPLSHPGEHLREDFLPDFGLTPDAPAKAKGAAPFPAPPLRVWPSSG